VVLWDINEAALAETVAELKARGGQVHPYIVDGPSSSRSPTPRRG